VSADTVPKTEDYSVREDKRV